MRNRTVFKRTDTSYNSRRNRDVYHFPDKSKGNFLFKNITNKRQIKRESSLFIFMRKFNFDFKFIRKCFLFKNIDNEYYAYKIIKENKVKAKYRDFTFYDNDGHLNYLKIVASLFSDCEFTKNKATEILFRNLKAFFKNQLVIDFAIMCVCIFVLAYIFFTLFFNFNEFIQYKIHFL